MAVYLKPTANFKPRIEVAAVFLEYEDLILFLHRQKNKSEGNKWGIPGGKVDKNETAKQAILRETKEETGYDISNHIISDLGSLFIEYDEKDHFIFHMFRTQLKGDPANIKINFREHKGFTWVTPEDALKLDLLRDEDSCVQLIYFRKYKGHNIPPQESELFALTYS